MTSSANASSTRFGRRTCRRRSRTRRTARARARSRIRGSGCETASVCLVVSFLSCGGFSAGIVSRSMHSLNRNTISWPQQSIAVPGSTQMKRLRHSSLSCCTTLSPQTTPEPCRCRLWWRNFLYEITLLGDEIAGQQQLARPIRIALEGPEVAGGTQHLRGGVLMVGHSCFPSSAQLRRGSDAAFPVERDRSPAGELRRACQHRGPAERALAEGHTLRHAADH